MRKYLYIFTYHRPDQRPQSEADPQDEASAAVFIEAASPEDALAWGRQVSEKFLSEGFGNNQVRWDPNAYAHWIETDPEREYPPEILARLPAVSVGVHPTFAQLRA